MPINLVDPLKDVANAYVKVKELDKKPKEMTEYQKEKIAVAQQKNEIAKGKLEDTKKKTAIAEQEAERKLNKDNRIATQSQKHNENLDKRRQVETYTAYEEAKAKVLKEKRLLQNSKNRKKRIEAQENLADEVYSITTTNKNKRSYLGALKTGPQKIGFSNIIQGGGVEDE